MHRTDVALILDEIGTLLELKGENPFKSRAYHNASRVVSTLENLDELVKEKRLRDVKGIGEAINEKITTLVTTGKLPYYDELHKSLPSGLMEIVKVQGVGPKRAKILLDKLKIKDLATLEKACRDGRIASLEGFGEKSQENILKGIAFLQEHSEYHLYDQAEAAAEQVISQLRKVPGVQRLSICGSLRRHREVIRDVDILVSSKKPEVVLERFTALPGVERILGQGPTKASVLLDGIQVDLRVLDDALFPFALHYFTGSKEHNIVVRQLAIEKGMKLSEYGLFKTSQKSSPAGVSGGSMDPGLRPAGMTSLKCKTEEELFEKLGLQYIPPEMREDRGEIDAAKAHRIPRLIEPGDIRGAFHVHSTWSDGKASLEDMIAEAEKLGWEYVGISDHSKTAAYAHGLTVDRVAQQGKEIERLRKKFKIHIFWGSECDILKDGEMDYPDKILAAYDFVIASVHSLFTLSEADQTLRIVNALKNKYVTILGHMTGRLLLGRDGYAVNTAEVLNAAAQEGAAIELNSDPHRFDIDWRQLPAAREKGIKISINPDAHSTSGLYNLPLGVGIARKGWLTKDDVLNTMPLAKVQAWLQLKRK